MSQPFPPAPRNGSVVPFVVTFGIAQINLVLITAGGACAVDPGVNNPGLLVAIFCAPVLVLSCVSWLVMRRHLQTATLRIAAKAVAGTFWPILIATPLFHDLPALSVPLIATASLAVISVFAAVLMPVCATLSWFTRRTDETSQAAVYRPIVPGELPESAQSFFLQRTLELKRMGFRVFGDYRVKEGMPEFARLLTRADGVVAAAIEHSRVGIFFHLRNTSFISVLDDGCYIETGNVAVPKGPSDPRDSLIMQSMPGGSVAEQLEKHDTTVSQASFARGSDPRELLPELLPEQLPALCRYGMKRLYDRLVREGKVQSNPYRDQDETLFCPVAAPEMSPVH